MKNYTEQLREIRKFRSRLISLDLGNQRQIKRYRYQCTPLITTTPYHFPFR